MLPESSFDIMNNVEEKNEQQGVGVVEPHITTLTLPPGGFKLEEGGSLCRVDVAWESCGLEKPENDNVVFICHALTGDAHVAGQYAHESEPSGWWEGIVGPGRAIDTNRYRVICANVLGGCKGTTGPSSINPETGKPYGSSFPKFTIGDTVNVYRALLRELGITHLAAIVGGSFGGIQVLEWVAGHPNEVDKAVMIASGAALNAQALAFDIVGRYAITLDPNWEGGDYYSSPNGGPKVGLAHARQVAHITYLSLALLNERFGRKQQQSWLDKGPEFLEKHASKFGTTFAIESYLGYQAKKFLARFDANSYLQITYAMDRYDAAEKYGSLYEACKRITSKMLLISLSGDWLFSEQQSRDIVQEMLKLRKDVSYSHLDVKVGHDGFLTNIEELSKVLGGYMRSGDIPPTIRDFHRLRYQAVMDMVKPSSHVLDIGCGSGRLMNMLRTEKNVTSVGVDIAFNKIVSSLKGGNTVVFDDIDEGLSVIPEGTYDLAVLSETLQAVKRPQELLRRILCIADEAVVSFPNFAELTVRIQLGLKGRMPKGKQLPFEWYNTPNIHLFTLKDFKALCKEEGIEIKEIRSEARGKIGRFLLALGFSNIGASRVTARIAKKNNVKK